jgi:bifunctional non-homologous end joining protein LigD
VHEIKRDGYRLIVRRDCETVRLFTRRGYDWTYRYRGIAVTAPSCAPSRSPWTARRRRAAPTASRYSTPSTGAAGPLTPSSKRSTCLELNGEELQPLPFEKRKAELARLLARTNVGIALNEHTKADGAAVFRQAWVMGLEGIVSKRLSAPYRSGPSRDWIKVKNPDSPAMVRHREGRW